MELRQLRYFLTVVDEQHFTRAAERLFVSQPALSQQIKQLEAELGVALIDRAGRRVRLTPEGQVIELHARRILQELEAARAALDELAGLQRGKLSVGVVQTVNAYLLPQVVAHFSRLYPGIKLGIEERSADAIEAGVIDGSLDLGMSFVPAASEEIEAEELFSEELVLIVAARHPWARRQRVAVRELHQQPLALLSTSFCTRRLWEACAARAGAQPRVVVEMNTVSGLLAAVQQMQSATILPALALAGAAAHGLTGVALVDPTPRRTVGLLQRRNGHRSAAMQAFARELRAQARELITAATETTCQGARMGQPGP